MTKEQAAGVIGIERIAIGRNERREKGRQG